MEDQYTYNTYSVGRIYLEEAWYTEDDLRKILDAIERQNKHVQSLIGETK